MDNIKSMDLLESHAYTRVGDLVQLVSPSNKVLIVRLIPGGQLQTHRGVVSLDELIGKPWGSQVFTHKGSVYYLLPPSLSDLLRETRRNTQIMYPKDIGFVLVTMGIGPGVHVLEAGTGSGALTTALAWAVGPKGHVTTYEARLEMQSLAIKNLESLGLAERVSFKLRNIEDGFDEQGVDALFMDIPNSYDYLKQVRAALKPGGYFGAILPTVNQVTHLLNALRQRDFAFVEVCEIILRYYQAVPDRLRPTNRMVAHTGFLIFARPMLIAQDSPESTLESHEESSEDHNNADDPRTL